MLRFIGAGITGFLMSVCGFPLISGGFHWINLGIFAVLMVIWNIVCDWRHW